MAIVATIIGGMCGFVAFLASLIATDMTLWSAVGTYALVGTAVTIGLMLTAILFERFGPTPLPGDLTIEGAHERFGLSQTTN